MILAFGYVVFPKMPFSLLIFLDKANIAIPGVDSRLVPYVDVVALSRT
jgi:hypothetical protein